MASDEVSSAETNTPKVNYEASWKTPSSESKPNRKKTSFVWEYFTVSESDIRKAVCNNCGASIVRGKDTRSFGTTSLASHIKFCHRTPGGNGSVRRVKRRRSVTGPFHQSMPKNKRRSSASEIQDCGSYVSPIENKSQEDVICSKRMDLVHSGLVMNVLYEQHKSGIFCDLTLISAPATDVKISAPDPINAVVPVTEKVGVSNVFETHSSVLAAVSMKIKTLIEMGSRTIELKDVSPFGLDSMLEIVYTGKLKRKTPLRFFQAHQIWKAASDLGVNYVHEYLANEHPEVAKWIADEEKQQEQMTDNDFIYEITGEDSRNNDLVDLCGMDGGSYCADPGLVDQEDGSVPQEPEGRQYSKHRVEKSEKMIEITFGKSPS